MQGQATQIIHAYKQAPWRVQRQWVGIFLLVVIGVAMVAALYLDVTARRWTGRGSGVRVHTTIRGKLLETQLADLTSTDVMQRRHGAGISSAQPGELITSPFRVYHTEPAILLAAEDANRRSRRSLRNIPVAAGMV
jgi:hypothetical protein